jgi:hypothetical protein
MHKYSVSIASGGSAAGKIYAFKLANILAESVL